MQKENKVLILGGAGLVGSAFAYKALRGELNRGVTEIIVTNYARNTNESLSGIEKTIEKFKELGLNIQNKGDNEWQTNERLTIKGRNFDLIPERIRRRGIGSSPREAPIYKLIKEIRPDIILNNIPTATAVSYGSNGENKDPDDVLIEYLDSLHRALSDFKVSKYIKIGTTGVGGMGYNIPFSHGEGGRPSKSLKLKNMVALGESAQYELWIKDGNFEPQIIEIKPGAALGFDRIERGKIKPLHRSKNLPEDVKKEMEENNAIIVCDPVRLNIGGNKSEIINWKERIIGPLASAYLRCGENGQFSRSEWLALTRPGLMELISGEDIAEIAIREANGRNTGYNYLITKREVNPKYSSALLRKAGADILESMKYPTDSEIFLNLGPERLSKLIFEAELIKRALNEIYKGSNSTVEELAKIDPRTLHEIVMTQFREGEYKLVSDNKTAINKMISVGIPVFTGESIFTGPYVAMPDRNIERYDSLDDILNDSEKIERNCIYCWVDLRPEARSIEIEEPRTKMYTGLEAWINRAKKIVQEAEIIKDVERAGRLGSAIGKSALWLPYLEIIKGIPDPEIGSPYETVQERKEIIIEPGELAGWVLEYEEKGGRYHI